jgi:hypothetical protein
MMLRTKKTTMMMTRTTKGQQSSENRTNVDTKDSGIWLLEITDYLRSSRAATSRVLDPLQCLVLSLGEGDETALQSKQQTG